MSYDFKITTKNESTILVNLSDLTSSICCKNYVFLDSFFLQNTTKCIHFNPYYFSIYHIKCFFQKFAPLIYITQHIQRFNFNFLIKCISITIYGCCQNSKLMILHVYFFHLAPLTYKPTWTNNIGKFRHAKKMSVTLFLSRSTSVILKYRST